MLCESEKKRMELIDAALMQLPLAYAPYSGFQVAAAVLTEQGNIYTGCNIENAAYGPSVCAERTAIFKAVSEGEREFRAIAIVGGKNGVVTTFCPPCGVCRQVMREFCDPQEFEIIFAKSQSEYQIYTLQELLPQSFGPELL
ncbi:MAG: cytidine deaminase [Lachnospiraceae bacterium]